MKTRYLLFGVSLLALTGCSTTHHSSAKSDPEKVLVTYHVKVGKEAEFREVLSRAWEIYRRDRLVFAEPHIIVQDTETEASLGSSRFLRGSVASRRSTLLRA